MSISEAKRLHNRKYYREHSKNIKLSKRKLTIEETILADLAIAERRAWDYLGHSNFQKFGYWAEIWTYLNKLSGENRLNPWHEIVKQAKEVTANA